MWLHHHDWSLRVTSKSKFSIYHKKWQFRGFIFLILICPPNIQDKLEQSSRSVFSCFYCSLAGNPVDSRWSFGNYFTSLHCNYLLSICKDGRSDLCLIRIFMFWLRKPRQAAMLCLQFRDTSKFIFLETDNDFWGKNT